MMKGAYFSFSLGEDVSINRSSKTEEWNLCEVVIEKDHHRQFITFFIAQIIFTSLIGCSSKKRLHLLE